MVERFLTFLIIVGLKKTLLDKSVPTCYTITILRDNKLKGGTEYVRENVKGILRIPSTVHPLRFRLRGKYYVRKNVKGIL